MPKFISAPPGTNPMEQPELIRRKRLKQWQAVAVIIGAVVLLCLVCGLPIYFLSRPPLPVTAAEPSPSPTATLSATETPTDAPTASSTPTATGTLQPTATGTRARTSTPAATQTPWTITQQVTKIVQVAGPGVPYPAVTHQVITVAVPMLQTVVITTTPEATQTPWIVEATRIIEVEVTRIVEVTPTETPTPTPTLEGIPALETPTLEAYP